MTQSLRLRGVTLGPRDAFEAMVRAIELHRIRPAIDERRLSLRGGGRGRRGDRDRPPFRQDRRLVLIRFLAFCGRRGTVLLAAGFFVGLAVPPLAALLRPLLSTFVFLLTASTMLGVDWRALAAHLKKPVRLALVIAWTMLGAPVAVAAALHVLQLPPPLAAALVLWAASPPLISVPAIAALLGLDPALALLVWALGTFLTPLSLPPLVLGLIGLPLDISILHLTLNLALFVLSAAALAGVRARAHRVRAHRRQPRCRLAASTWCCCSCSASR